MAAGLPLFRSRNSGFTLVETLVVLAILGGLAGVAVIGVGAGDRGALAETAANRLANRLTLAADEALVTATPLRLDWDREGYGFEAYADGQWQPHGEEFLGARQGLAGGLTLAGESDRLVILPGGIGAPARFTIGGRGDWTIDFDGLTATAAPAS